MAKQTINIGASPNDGTGTPLRTAFDYCNLNFTELYTATGPSGNNIVVPGSATITGDLTVDTSTLKVDSANNRVGIGTATPGYLLDVQAATAVANILSTTGTNTAYLQISNTGGYFYLGRENSAGTTFAAPAYSAVLYAGGAYPLVTTVNGGERYRIASDGVATWSNVGGVAGTAMTLNSTGLGVGVSPAHKLQAVGGYVASGKLASASSGDIGGLLMYCSTDNGGRRSWGLKAESGTTGVLGFWLSSANNTEPFSGTQVMSLDASGNWIIGGTSQISSSRASITNAGGDQLAINATNTSTGQSAIKFCNAGTAQAFVWWDKSDSRFYVQNSSGGVYLASTATSWTSNSDERLKDIIEPISNAVSKVGSLRAIIGKYKNDETNTRRSFLIAQDVQSVLPEAVDASNPDKLGVAYTDVIPLLVAAIKELTARVQTLETR